MAASEGAAVRDETGRTYTAAAVALPSLRLSALRLAVAMAVSSGAQKLEAAALVSDADLDPGDLAVVRDLGPDATVFHAAPDGTVRETLTPVDPHRSAAEPGHVTTVAAVRTTGRPHPIFLRRTGRGSCPRDMREN